jgi:hypothetical protein
MKNHTTYIHATTCAAFHIMTNLRGQEEYSTRPVDLKGECKGRNRSREGNDPVHALNAVIQKQTSSSPHEGNDRFSEKRVLALIQELFLGLLQVLTKRYFYAFFRFGTFLRHFTCFLRAYLRTINQLSQSRLTN